MLSFQFFVSHIKESLHVLRFVLSLLSYACLKFSCYSFLKYLNMHELCVLFDVCSMKLIQAIQKHIFYHLMKLLFERRKLFLHFKLLAESNIAPW